MRKSALSSAKRIVVKVGSSQLVGASGPNREFIAHLAGQVAAEHARGREVILVSSGAIATGRHKMGATKSPSEDMPMKQALAAVGQPELMNAYLSLFAQHSITAAQVLLTRDAFQNRERFTNAQNTIEKLLYLGAVPIVNENDTVATEEIRFGENDVLAAYMALLISADALIMLTDVEGFYDAPPDEGGELLRLVERVTEAHTAAAGTGTSAVGSGGMASKLLAARMVSAAGAVAVIAKGDEQNVVTRVLDGEEIGTFFVPAKERLRGKRRWLAFAGQVMGEIRVDEGAARALVTAKKSLLPRGITDVIGAFAAGDIVDVICHGELVGRGVSEFSGDDLRLIKGRRSEEIAGILGRACEPEAVHRDNLVVLEGIW